MANSLSFRRIGFALVAVITFLPPAIRAKEFVSNKYGFQISLPPGFREQHADAVNIIAEFIEPQSEAGGYPITIDIRHTGSNYNPSGKTDASNVPLQKAKTRSSETRRWRDLDLQVVRQELAASSDVYVNYTIVFPLVDDGIMVFAQGEKSRDKEIVRIFDSCIRQFVNLNPYAAVTEDGQLVEGTHSIGQVLETVFLPAVSVA